MAEWFMVLFMITSTGTTIERIPMQNKAACEAAGSVMIYGFDRIDSVWCVNGWWKCSLHDRCR